MITLSINHNAALRGGTTWSNTMRSLDCYDGAKKARIIDRYPHPITVLVTPLGVQVSLSEDLDNNRKDITHCTSAELHRWLYQR